MGIELGGNEEPELLLTGGGGRTARGEEFAIAPVALLAFELIGAVLGPLEAGVEVGGRIGRDGDGPTPTALPMPWP